MALAKSLIINILIFLCVSLGSSLDAFDNNDRVVGGTDAPKGFAPFQVSLRDKRMKHFCGGSILNERWVLTAAHCLVRGRLDAIYVGSNTLNRGGRYYDIKRYIVHEEYNRKTLYADIGLIEVDEDLKFNDLVKSIPRRRQPIVGGEDVTAIGWGLTIFNATNVPNELQKIKLKTLKKDECELRGGVSAPSHICTFVGENFGVCQGDSGGPLILNDELVGLTSFGLLRCAHGFPDFFSSVIFFNKWIDEKIK